MDMKKLIQDRLRELEKEIEDFNSLRKKRQGEFQQFQGQFQREFVEIDQAILAKKGGIIELKKLEFNKVEIE